MKWIIRGVVALVLIVVVALIVVVIAIDGVARRGIESGASYAMGVPTTLGNASVGIFSGKFAMSDLNVANPEGFDSSHFLKLGGGEVAVSLGSLMSDTVEIGRIALTGLEMNLEKKGGRDNVKEILDNLQKLSSAESKPDDKDDGGKQFVIREIDIGEITVNLTGYPMAKSVKVAPIRLTNVGSAGEPIDMAYLTGIIMRSIFQSMLAGGIELPSDLNGLLGVGLQGLGGLGGVNVERLGEVGGKIGAASSRVSEQLPGDAGKQVDDAAGKIQEGLGGLLGGQKKDDKKE
jgi:hypothetical protein